MDEARAVRTCHSEAYIDVLLARDEATPKPAWCGAIDAEGLPAGLHVAGEQIRHGFGLFFHNRYDECEAFFANYADAVPLFALGSGTMACIRAVISFDPQDREEAQRRLVHAEDLAVLHCGGGGGGGALGALARLVGGRSAVSSAELQHKIIAAEARLQYAFQQLLDESYLSYIKAGLNIRSAWKSYEWVQAHVEAVPALDAETRAALQFGLGMFNTVVSLLPPKLVQLASVLGFASDHRFGLEQLEACHASTSIRAPLASTALCVLHVIMPGFFSFDGAAHVSTATAVLDRALADYADSGLFLFMRGRLLRLQRLLREAEAEFERAALGLGNWPPLLHLCQYELGWTCLFGRRLEQARRHFDALCASSSWSPAFYRYMVGVLDLALGDAGAAAASLRAVPGLVQRKFGGRTISVEQYVMRKVHTYVVGRDGVDGLHLPLLEFSYLWNGFTQTPEAILLENLGEIDAWRRVHPHAERLAPESHLVCLLLEAALYSQLGQPGQAMARLGHIEESRKNVVEERWIVPHARYERALLFLQAPRPDSAGAAEQLEGAKSYKQDYNFEMRLRLRIHMAERTLRDLATPAERRRSSL